MNTGSQEEHNDLKNSELNQEYLLSKEENQLLLSLLQLDLEHICNKIEDNFMPPKSS